MNKGNIGVDRRWTLPVMQNRLCQQIFMLEKLLMHILPRVMKCTLEQELSLKPIQDFRVQCHRIFLPHFLQHCTALRWFFPTSTCSKDYQPTSDIVILVSKCCSVELQTTSWQISSMARLAHLAKHKRIQQLAVWCLWWAVGILW